MNNGVDHVSHPHLLPMEVYEGQEALFLESWNIDKSQHNSCNMVFIWQRSIDIEHWLNEQLEEILPTSSLSLQCIADYDVQIVEVSSMHTESSKKHDYQYTYTHTNTHTHSQTQHYINVDSSYHCNAAYVNYQNLLSYFLSERIG